MPGIYIGTRLYTSPGYLILEEDGRRSQLAISEILRAADIPTGLTYSQVQGLTTLANMCALVIRALIDSDAIDESIFENSGYTLESITEAIEQLGGDYGEPDLSVEE